MSFRSNRRVIELALVGLVLAVAVAGAGLYWKQRNDGGSGPVANPGPEPPEPPTVVAPESTLAGPLPTIGAGAYAAGTGPASFPSAACSSTAVAGAKFVAVTGDDRSAGSADAPFRTIQKGIESLTHGQTLFVRAGDYYNKAPDGREDSLIHIDRKGPGGPDRWLTVCAYPGERPVLHANNTDTGAVYMARTNYIHVEGFSMIGASKGLKQAPRRGADAKGFMVGHYPYYDSELNHVRIWNNWITGFGASGIQLNLANNVDIRGNRIWDNAHWSGFATSGISSWWPSAGTGNDANGYGIYIVGNLIWDNYMDDSLYDPKSQFGLTDGNCIIIDEHGHYTDLNRTRVLIKNNVCVANGGTGLAMTRSGNADVVNNTFYRNSKTTLRSVVNNGEIMCQSMEQAQLIGARSVQTKCENVNFKNNVVVARQERKAPPLVRFGPSEIATTGNVWVKSGFDAPRNDTTFDSSTNVITAPDEANPLNGNWTTTGPAAGKGAPWPLATQ